MSLQLAIEPNAVLAPHVQIFWYVQQQPAAHHLEKILPDGSAELIINLDQEHIRRYSEAGELETELPGAIVLGPQSRAVYTDTAQQRRVIGIHFRPGGAYPFFGCDLDQLHLQQLGLEDLWGSQATRLRQRLLEADPMQALHLLQDALLERMHHIRDEPHLTPALQMLRGGGAMTITEVGQRLQLSPRRLIQMFRQRVGMSPKRYARVRRLQATLDQLEQQPKPELAQLALHLGFYDQAHMYREFKSFTGCTPLQYLARRHEDHRNHLPMPAS